METISDSQGPEKHPFRKLQLTQRRAQGLRAQLRLEQQLLRSKYENVNYSCPDFLVELPVPKGMPS
jgi:hypothetical protein